MRVGVVFPTREIEPDAKSITGFAAAIESLGYQHVMAYDHVIGVDPATNPSWEGKYDLADRFHEPLILLGYLAAVSSLELSTGVLVLPQRQTALVAKQVAQIDLLSGGRVRLGVGIGWNEFEYDALGVPFARRGARIEEQVQLIRRLWADDVVRCNSDFHTFEGIGLSPKPTRSIPIWIGAHSESGLHRIGRVGDGLIWLSNPNDRTVGKLDCIKRGADEVGRDSSTIGLDVHIPLRPGVDIGVAADLFARWSAIGATHATVTTSAFGYDGIDEQLAALASFSGEVGLAPATAGVAR